MWIRCSLYDDDVRQTTSSAGLIGKRSLLERVKHVTGITLSKDDVIIATVNAYFPAAMENGVDLGDVSVDGDVSQTTGELG